MLNLRNSDLRETIENRRMKNIDGSRYELFDCGKCDQTYRHASTEHPEALMDRVRRHLKSEHPEVFERDEYENEAAFREWAERMGLSVIEPDAPREPLQIAVRGGYGTVELHRDGTIILTAFRTMARGGIDDVRVEGERLSAVSPDGDRTYVSPRAFPVMDG